MIKLKVLLENPIIVKYKIIILPIISIAISLFLLIFIVFEQVSSSIKRQEEITDTKTKVSDLTQKNNDLEKIDDTSFKDYLTTSLIAIPEEKDIAGAIGQLLFILRSHNLNLDNIGFSNASPENGLESFQISLEIQGDMSDMKALINDFKSTPRIIKLNSIELTSTRNSQTAHADIMLTAYFSKLPVNIGSVDEVLKQPTAEELKLIATIKENIQKIPLSNTQDATGSKGKADPFQ